ncbi:DUF5683 domain-containing protein [Mucilaginibacter myungsuensis]|uniref:DUF5683 domain-containing protein n=1 Tax=Mucilaginibacter myungsuensis TaxID=649104 RepID=A0A929KXQ8_9SPHI|nr:DUF5683 domain-containing protein [Mucilaginibacter myungsuensis]MBE9661868.1 hypothetical protein [Mucilaginibacter myungsuensis]MDN3599698.1 DUF5683 domain-containing protein [Mucilaginibacter myungsuensis]
MRYILITILLITGIGFSAMAQKPDTVMKKNPIDSAYQKKDTDPSKQFDIKPKKVKVYIPDSTHSPRKAWTRSAILPGLGQIYNGHWWKVPAIYAGLGLLGNAYITNGRDYRLFLAVAQYRRLGINIKDNPEYYANDSQANKDAYVLYGNDTRLTDQAIIDAKDGFYRNLQISALSFVLVWGVNVVDAYIYGKLKHSFSMDDNFEVHINGTLMQQPIYASNFNFNNFTPALKLTVTF